jgi:ATP sulfurylase
MKMASGLFWPIPITLSTDKATADSPRLPVMLHWSIPMTARSWPP